jgi:hypothetical protein
MKLPSSLNTYLNITLLYGFVRGVYKNHDSYCTYRNSQTYREEEKPRLLTEKVSDVMKQTFLAPVVWPFLLGRDAVYLELYIRNKDPATYGRPPYREDRLW